MFSTVQMNISEKITHIGGFMGELNGLGFYHDPLDVHHSI